MGERLHCVDGVVLRLGNAPITNGNAVFPNFGGGDLATLGLVTLPGTTRVYQALYRNSVNFCTSAASNATNGLSVTWGPHRPG